MNNIRPVFIPMLLATTLLITGCVGVSASKSYKQDPTLGQQLTDLKKAHDLGAIDDEEFEQLKRGIIGEAESSRRR